LDLRIAFLFGQLGSAYVRENRLSDGCCVAMKKDEIRS